MYIAVFTKIIFFFFGGGGELLTQSEPSMSGVNGLSRFIGDFVRIP